MIYETVLLSFKYDSQEEAKRITRLVDLIRKNNRKISEKTIEQVKRGRSDHSEVFIVTLRTSLGTLSSRRSGYTARGMTRDS